jgi:hypothetical protein
MTMRNLEAYAGSVVWAAVAMLMTAAALEPVELARADARAATFAAAACADADTCEDARA